MGMSYSVIDGEVCNMCSLTFHHLHVFVLNYILYRSCVHMNNNHIC